MSPGGGFTDLFLQWRGNQVDGQLHRLGGHRVGPDPTRWLHFLHLLLSRNNVLLQMTHFAPRPPVYLVHFRRFCRSRMSLSSVRALGPRGRMGCVKMPLLDSETLTKL